MRGVLENRGSMGCPWPDLEMTFSRVRVRVRARSRILPVVGLRWKGVRYPGASRLPSSAPC